MRGITKRFGRAVALNGIDLEVLPGEVHALLGENGAGKSTLMHVLGGLTRPDAGVIELDGRPMRFRSAREAAAAGVGMVHQHFVLADDLTVAENLALALPEQTPFFLPRHGLAEKALADGERLGWKLEPSAYVWQLSVGQQQRLEIIKALAAEPRVLILDEPTAVLAPAELDEFFAVLGRLRSAGRSLIFITHKLQEVMRLADRVTVLRHGRNAGTLPIAETNAEDLARRMIGAEEAAPRTAAVARRPPEDSTTPILSVQNAVVRDGRGLESVRGLSLEVRAGEILGLAGVDGNGQAELAEAIMGLRAIAAGSITIEGKAPREAGRETVGYIPQDRRREGLIPPLSTRDNLVLELAQTPAARQGPWLRWPLLNERAGEMLHDYDIRASGLDQPAETLSGGNQQKIVIARALDKRPALIVAVNPTRGLDPGATAYVRRQLLAQRERGAAILLISTELDEVMSLSDRIGVLYGGRLAGMVGPDATAETLGLLMGGKAPAEAAA